MISCFGSSILTSNKLYLHHMHKFKKHGRKQTHQQPGWMSESPTWVTTLKISGKVKRGLPFSRGVFSHDGKGDSQWSFTEREILTCSEGLWSFHQRCVRQLLKSYCVRVGSVPYPGGGGDGGYSWEFLVGVCCPVPQILIQFQTKKCNFPNPFSV